MPEFVGPLSANMKRAWVVAGAAVGCALLTASTLSYLYWNPLAF